jgi:hypothetical protein
MTVTLTTPLTPFVDEANRPRTPPPSKIAVE